MMKFSLLLLTSFAGSVIGMRGGVDLTKKFDYFVFFITGDKNYVLYNFNDTTPHPNPKWQYCMGVLYKTLTVVTAELCRVEPDGMHWATTSGADIDQIHPVKSVIPGRHPLDFRVVEVRNSSIGRWSPLGKVDPTLMVTPNEAELREFADRRTKGIVATVSKPPRIGAMMMISLEECGTKYVHLLKSFPETTSLMANELPKSVFCAVEASEAFDPNKQNPRHRRQNDATTDGGATAGDEGTTGAAPVGGPTKAVPPVNQPTMATIDVGPVAPAVACPDSLGSPFIIAGGKVLGILVAADCHTANVSFFQSLVEDLPTFVDYDLNDDSSHRTYWPPPPRNKTYFWTPKAPMVKGLTLRPVGWEGGPGPKLFSVASSSAPSALFITMGLVYTLEIVRQLKAP